jgi:uncharacterized phage protein (TIGR02218 family)
MQPVNSQMITALSDGTTHLCRIWELVLANGQTFRFTDLTSDITVGGEVFKFDPGIEVSSVVISSGGQPDNAQITLRAGPDFVSKLEIRNGVLRNAIFRLWVVDYRNPDYYGPIELFAGSTAENAFDDTGKTRLALNSDLGGGTNRNIGERYSRQCRATFGDHRCKFPVEDYKLAFTVSAVYGEGYKFAATEFIGPGGMSEDNIYKFGKIVWTEGLNAGHTDEVKESRILVDSGEITLALLPRYPVGLGDEGFAYFGCDFNITTCQHRYWNAANFRGEPYVPPPQVYVFSGTVPEPSIRVDKDTPAYAPFAYAATV